MTPTREANQGLRRHKLMTAEDRAKLPALRAQDGMDGDAVAYVKFFSPYGSGRYTFFVTEFDGDDLLFGWCVSAIDPDYDEWSYASLSELAKATVHGVPAIERDCSWSPTTVREATA